MWTMLRTVALMLCTTLVENAMRLHTKLHTASYFDHNPTAPNYLDKMFWQFGQKREEQERQKEIGKNATSGCYLIWLIQSHFCFFCGSTLPD